MAKHEYFTRTDALQVIADNDIPCLRFGANADEDGPPNLGQRRVSLDLSKPRIGVATGPEERAYDALSIFTSFSSETSNASRSICHAI